MDNICKMNHKPRETANKESVYGWYPPQWNIYSKPLYKQHSQYEKECLHKQWYLSYLGKEEAKTPAPPAMGRPPQSTPHRQQSAPLRRSVPSLRQSRPQSVTTGLALKRQIQKLEEQRKQLAQELSVDTTVPYPRNGSATARPVATPAVSVTPSPSTIIRRSWKFNKPKEYALMMHQGPNKIPKPDLRDFGFNYGTPEVTPIATPCESEYSVVTIPEYDTRGAAVEYRPKSALSPSRPKTISRRSIRSATVRRPTFQAIPGEKLRETQRKAIPTSVPIPTTSVASPISPSSSVCEKVNIETVKPVPPSRTPSVLSLRVKSAPPTTRSPVDRPETPTPNQAETTPTPRPESASAKDETRPVVTPEEDTEEIENSDEELTYEELVDKYGWKVQIPGDPLKLKKSVIRDRLSYAVQCSEPDLAKDPPKVHRQVWDTFFLNTIPRNPAAFTIAPDWVSEVLHGKRMDLQKREDGINYRYKDFAFVY